jgi:nitroreductase
MKARGPIHEGKDQLVRGATIRSSALAGMTLMLAAKGLGYDSCPMVCVEPVEVAKLIRLPADHVLSFMVAVGKQSWSAWPPGGRLPESEVFIHQRFGGSGTGCRPFSRGSCFPRSPRPGG